MTGDSGTQHLTALAAPETLVDWRLAICFESAYTTGILDEFPASAERIAARLGLDEGVVRAVLQVLVAWEYVDVDDRGVYSDGKRRLSPRERAALAQHGTWIRRWAALVPLRLHDRRATAFGEPERPDPVTGLALLESACRPYVAPVVKACLSSFERGAEPLESVRVLDLGGGHGAYAREFARRGCETTMQDLPPVIDQARADRRMEEAEVHLVAGDLLVELADGPFDLVLCATLTNLFGLWQVRDLFERLRGRLSPHGRLVIATWARDRGPVGAAFGVQMIVATENGDAHGWKEYEEVLTATGYSDIHLLEIGRPVLSLLVAHVPG